jgi:hypothetical protein
MKIRRLFAGALLICLSVQTQSQNLPHRIVIAASRILDGRGHVLKNTRIVVEGNKIVAIDPKASPIDYDLRELTVLPAGLTHMRTSRGVSGRMGRTQELARRHRTQPIEPQLMHGLH